MNHDQFGGRPYCTSVIFFDNVLTVRVQMYVILPYVDIIIYDDDGNFYKLLTTKVHKVSTVFVIDSRKRRR